MKQINRTNGMRWLSAAALAVGLAGTSIGDAEAAEFADEDITRAITTDLMSDNRITANLIDVGTQDGIVTLSGTVDNLLAKDRAAAIAESIVGVRAVVNQIAVLPATLRDDAELAQAVRDAWLADPATEAYQMDVSAEDGTVTLTGAVDSYQEKHLAETVAKGVWGVRDMVNRIDVDYESDRTDYEIQKEIEARLLNDVRVDDALIDVTVQDGMVTLSGAVGSLQEKNRARVDAWVAGVARVSTDELDIDYRTRDDMRRDEAAVDRSDEEIRKAVLDAFLYDPRVLSFEPEVDVSSGVVTLSGTVSNPAAKQAAEQDARNTLGVIRVYNNIKVRPGEPAMSDEELEQRVSKALRADTYVDRYQVDVDAVSGWIYLSGDANTSFEKDRAEYVAERVKGVAGVVNNIEYAYSWQWKPDREIKDDVEGQLFWSPFVDSDDVTVAVDDGVVSLNGTVNSWSEREDAETNAYQGGAKDVENNLTVDYQYYGPYGPNYTGPPPYGTGYYGQYRW